LDGVDEMHPGIHVYCAVMQRQIVAVGPTLVISDERL
jgi:hypothetical protein